MIMGQPEPRCCLELLTSEDGGERGVGGGVCGQGSLAGELGGAVWGQAGVGEALDGLGGGQGVEPAQAGGAAGLRGEVAEQAEPRQAAVGVGVEGDGGGRAGLVGGGAGG